MLAFETWLIVRATPVAALIDAKREAICEYVSQRLAASYPTLCYDPLRSDARLFQAHTFSETPQRFHRLVQAALRFRSLPIIEREYYWGWSILARQRVERHHMQAQVRWYYQGVRDNVVLDAHDVANLETFTSHVLLIIDRVTGRMIHASDGLMRGRRHSSIHSN